METRTLSSPFTLFFKFVFAPMWIIGWGMGTLPVLLHPDTVTFYGVKGAPPHTGLAFVVLWVIGTAFAIAFGWGLKEVRVEGDQLVVSNYLRQARIPLAMVSNVRWRRYAHGGSVALDFAEPTDFGRSVTFIAASSSPRSGRNLRTVREQMEREMPIMRANRILREVRSAIHSD